MAANKIKFEMKLKELAFKFEGDYEQGQRIQTGITRALSDISSLQSNAMGAREPKLIEAQVSNVPPVRRKRRKAAQNGEPGAPDAADGSENAGEVGQRRTNDESPTQLLIGLRKTGFFGEGKTANQILGHLSTKGHTGLAHSDLTSPLQKLCQREVLIRTKPNGKVWQYANGSRDE
jgi:hypothetical protein